MLWDITWRQLWFIFYLGILSFSVTISLEDFHEECDENDYFRCRSGQCISKSFVCDGEVDCGGNDSSDEEACHLLTTLPPRPCSKSEFQCTDRLCIPAQWVCDNEYDCTDGSDEIHGCLVNTCDPVDFQCKSKSCIPKEWECDGSRDCPDNSDEDHCENKHINTYKCDIHDGFYSCADGNKCIKLSDVCNHHADCADGSDEGKQCYEGSCKEMKCPKNEKCINLPEGPHCIQFCQKGYTFKTGVCEDIDECENFGQCDQVCHNTIGGYNCSCVDGYIWSPEHGKCKADGGEGLLMFSTNDEVRAYFLESRVYYEVATKLPHATGIAYDGHNVYWTTFANGEETIVKASEHGEDQRIIVTSGIGSPEDLAIDWVTKTIYFTDSRYKHIGVCSNDGFVCTVIHNKDIDKPRAITLHSSEGLMYWTDWGARPLIARSGMDGSEVFDFVTENVHWPNGLSIDHGSNRLYWVDAKEGTIECIKLDGHDRKKIPSTAVKHPFSIEVFENKIFWSDWDTNQIQACNKFTGHDCHVVVRERSHKIYGIHIYHPSLSGPHVANPCYDVHCSDLCLLAPKNNKNKLQYSCKCPYHKKLSKDNHTCVKDNDLDLIMLGAGQTLVSIEHKSFGGFVTKSVELHHLRKIGALAYDPTSGKIILSDLIMKSIVSYNWETSEAETLVEHVGRVIALEVDYYGNNLYWLDEEKKTLEIINLKSKFRKTLLRDFGDEIPTDIALVLDSGYMFIAFHTKHGSHIDRISMDARPSSRTHVIETELLGPLSLFFDTTLARLFWADRNGGLIMTTDDEGRDRHLHHEMDSAPVGIATLDTDVFWVTYGSNKMYWSNKFDPNNYKKEFIVDQIKDTDRINIIGIHQHPLFTFDGCNTLNCSHFCLLSLKNVVCGCPDGLELEFNKETCRKQLICKEDEFKCFTGECISRSLRCNGRQDCQGGEDEAHCSKICPPHYFACADGNQCVPQSARCNKKLDCLDSSDEQNCQPENCTKHEFHCVSGECIPLPGRCDMIIDCNDGSDENNCEEVRCSKNEFRCTSGSCIPSSWVCDLQIDCPDGSDEGSQCRKKEECHEFSCGNGHCISKKLVCNGEDDCEDMTDEEHCTTGKSQNSTSKSHCPFICPTDSSSCLPLSAKCDGKMDCPGGEDEYSCPICHEDQFTCNSKKCIPKAWECDNVNDCGDDSDELHCRNFSDIIHSRKQDGDKECGGFLCKEDDICLPLHKLCDSHPDCTDGSDEKGLCGSKTCEHAGCQQECHETPEGPKCLCHQGFKLNGDARSCSDIDECEMMSSCSQLCLNTIGSYRCSCLQPGYHLRSDKISCKAKGGEMKYFYATEKLIKYKSQSLQETGLIFKSKYKLDIKGLMIDVINQTVYWTSEMSGHLVKMSIRDPADIAHISKLIRPTKVAYDWLSDNVYILESANTIRACSFKLLKCAFLYKSEQSQTIDALTIDTKNRLVIWAETTWYMMKQRTVTLKKASMSGDNITNIINLDDIVIGDIAVDSIHSHIYWSDKQARKIERCNYEGKQKEFVMESQNPPVNLMIFEDYLYYLNAQFEGERVKDDYTETLTKFGLYGSAYQNYDEIRLLPRSSSSHVSAVYVGQEALQAAGYNPCLKSKCLNLCVPTIANKSICICEDGKRVKPGEKCTDTTSQGLEFSITKNHHDQNISTTWAWIWWILALVLVGGMCYMVYRFYCQYYKHEKIHRSVSVFFPVERNEDNEPTIRTALAPGQHQYENPTFAAVT